jgi:septum formation protein
MKKRVVLASASPRRAKLLKEIIKGFEIIPSGIDETRIPGGSPEDFAVIAALAKAEDVAKRVPQAVVIGADTIVVLENRILGKPKDDKDAIKMLEDLSGNTHRVITGIAVIDPETQQAHTAYEITNVKMRKVSDKDIIDYVKSGKPFDKAGSYGIQEIEGIFIDKIEGDYDNVVGLPVKKLKTLLKRLSSLSLDLSQK